MKIITTYKVKINGYDKVFSVTTKKFRDAEEFYLDVIQKEWPSISLCETQNQKINMVESLTVTTKKRNTVPYDFGDKFYKFPSYYRRAVIAKVLGKVSSYQSNLSNWEKEDKITRGKCPSMPQVGSDWAILYKDECYVLNEEKNTCLIKVWIRNTWDWVEVSLNKSDMEYIRKHCSGKKRCSPTLRKNGKKWYLSFPFEENRKLADKTVWEQTVVAVDLGINNACVCSVLKSDGTVLGRHFLSLPKENDSLQKALGRLIKAQKHGAVHTPRLWAKVIGINNDIAVKTSKFIEDISVLYNADVIVFEHLTLNGKKHGKKKQRLHLWKAKAIQDMVTLKAHRMGMHISRICAWGTSKLAFDGSGAVQRGEYTDGNGNKHYNYSVCTFKTGRQYNCDLNASYNIGARYFIREILKSLTEKEGLELKAKVPELSKRTTCTLSSLIKLNAGLYASA